MMTPPIRRAVWQSGDEALCSECVEPWQQRRFAQWETYGGPIGAYPPDQPQLRPVPPEAPVGCTDCAAAGGSR